jgi:hypothetical protein
LLHDRLPAGLLLAGLLLRVPAVHAGHPMLSEDTGTQGARNFELELGYDWSRLDGSSSFLFQPQLSVGTSASFDLIVQPSWLRDDDPMGTVTRGLGDTNLDFKWRFFGAAPLTLAIRAGLELPTAQRDLGLPGGHVGAHGLLVATIDVAPWTIDLNAGYSRVSYFPVARSDLMHFSAATLYSVNERLVLLIDASVDSDPDRTEPSAMGVALLGAIYTVHPGLDLDAGYRIRLDAGAPAQQWLIGVTYRGAL